MKTHNPIHPIHAPLEIVQPMPDSAASKLWDDFDIWPGSIAVLTQIGDRSVVYFEGGVYERKRSDPVAGEQRNRWARIAAGRALQGYPTRAHFYLVHPGEIESLQALGQVTEDYQVSWYSAPRSPGETVQVPVHCGPPAGHPVTVQVIADAHDPAQPADAPTGACPACGSDETEGAYVDICHPNARQECSCLACGSTWTDIYTLTRQTNVMPADPELPGELAGPPLELPDAACHGFMCPRKYVKARDLPPGADPFVKTDATEDGLHCPECGGIDVY